MCHFIHNLFVILKKIGRVMHQNQMLIENEYASLEILISLDQLSCPRAKSNIFILIDIYT